MAGQQLVVPMESEEDLVHLAEAANPMLISTELMAHIDGIFNSRLATEQADIHEMYTTQFENDRASLLAQVTQQQELLNAEATRYAAEMRNLEARLTPQAAQTLPPPPPQTGQVPDSLKLPLPASFSKGRDLLPGWVTKVETWTITRNFHHCIMSLVPLMLSGEAEAWWNALRAADKAPKDWPTFRAMIEKRFGNPYREQDARDRFDNMRPSRYVSHTRAEVEQLLPDLSSMAEHDLVHQFQSKLSGTVRFEMERAAPQTLEKAFELAESIERAERLSHLGQGTRGEAPGPSRGYAPRGRVRLNAMQGDPAKRPPLTEQEREALRLANGCFYCRQPNADHVSRHCPLRPSSDGNPFAPPRPERRTRPGNGQGRRR